MIDWVCSHGIALAGLAAVAWGFVETIREEESIS